MMVIRADKAGGVLCRPPHAKAAQRKGRRGPCSAAAGPLAPQDPVSPQQGLAAILPCHKMDSGRSHGRPHTQLLYLNSFDSHRCSPVIRHGRACCQQAEMGQGRSLLSRPNPTREARGLRATLGAGKKVAPGLPADSGRRQAVGSCGGMKPVSCHHGDLRKAAADIFEFPFPSKNVDKAIKRKKKKSKVWLKVWKVISKMVEENEKLRRRLLACSQFKGEGRDTNPSSQNEASYLDREESIFGWI